MFLSVILGVLVSGCKETKEEESHNGTDEVASCRAANEQIIFPSQMDLAGGWNRVSPSSTFNIWRVDSDGTNFVPITKNTHGQLTRIPNVSRSGKLISFYSFMNLNAQSSSPAALSANIWVVNRWGEKLQPVTRNDSVAGLGTFGSMIVSDTKIVFDSTTSLDGKWNGAPVTNNIWVSNIDGSERKPLTMNTLTSFRTVPAALSPAEDKIAILSTTDFSGDWDRTSYAALNVWVLDLLRPGKTVLTRNTLSGLDMRSARYFPDGKRIAVLTSSSLSGAWDGTPSPRLNIWIINSDGTGFNAITRFTKSNILSVEVSPKGDKILFHGTLPINGVDSAALPASNIWLMNADGTNLIPITRNTKSGFQSYAPMFSPDGTKIGFFSNTEFSGVWDGTKTSSSNLWVADISDLAKISLKPITQNSLTGLDSSSTLSFAWAPKIDCKKAKKVEVEVD
ncbi:MAG: hypothetical protein A4S09_00270 [Proteobacteria bacterium SG_bin7]|nr:MAG: hypothetical protein A4S09_00270 [Proteobacteria bacterium SG_bin7]